MSELRECPCGAVPEELYLVERPLSRNGIASAYPQCCGAWHIDFFTHYLPVDSEACMELAEKAWNKTIRAKDRK